MLSTVRKNHSGNIIIYFPEMLATVRKQSKPGLELELDEGKEREGKRETHKQGTGKTQQGKHKRGKKKYYLLTFRGWSGCSSVLSFILLLVGLASESPFRFDLIVIEPMLVRFA
jgi:hypothetical protein